MTTPQPARLDGRDQALSLVDFLSAYDARRNPPVRDISRYQLYRLPCEAVPEHERVRVHPDEDVWLTVEFLDLPPAPQIPSDAAPFFQGAGVPSALDEPVLVSPPPPTAHPGPDGMADLRALTLDAEARREWEVGTAAAERWIDGSWRPWAEDWRRVAAVKSLHRSLFEQRERLVLDRDSVELVWGFGRLRWHGGSDSADQDRTADRVDHPMITVTVEVDLDPDTQQIRVRPAGAPEVEGRYLHHLDIHDRTGFTAIRRAAAADDVDVWSGEMADLLRRLVRSIDDKGIVVDKATGNAEHAVVDLDWVLFMRRRVPDSQGFLDAMRALYGQDHPIPEPLRVLVAPLPRAADTTDAPPYGEVDGSAGSPAESLLLPLDSNEEQARILESAQRHPGVVVQGPPGTGKSHTIANLISHHVAHGRRVLVVAEKEQSLKVLADKVPAEIRDLIVSILGADEESRRRLGAAITNIQSSVAAVDPGHSDNEISRLTVELDGIDRRLAATRTAFLRAREAETRRLTGDWAAGSPVTPQTAAEWLNAHPQLDLIPDRITPEVPPPDVHSFTELLSLLDSIGPDRAEQAVRLLPDPVQLPTAAEFAGIIDQLDRAQDAAGVALTRISDWPAAESAGLPAAQWALQQLHHESAWRADTDRTWAGEVLRRIADPLQGREWFEFARRLTDARARIMELRARVRAHDVQLPGDNSPDAAGNSTTELQQQLTEAHQRFSTSGKLGFFAKDAKRAIERCRVDGHSPGTADEVRLCLDALEITDLRRRVTTLWINQAAGVAGPLPAGLVEDCVVEPLALVEQALAAPARWQRVIAALYGIGIRDVGSPSPGNIDSLRAAVAGLVQHLQTAGASRQIADLASTLASGASTANASPLWHALATALAARDAPAWGATLSEVVDLRTIAAPAHRLRMLWTMFRAATPIWAQRFAADRTAAGDPARLHLMWQWRQLDTWVTELTAGPSPVELQAALAELLAARKRTVTRLVAARAWRRMAANLGAQERQALTAYLKAATRFGKTGGKFAQRWTTLMRLALDDAKTAVPVWIMPTAKALTSFRPAAIPPFDVLIVDEASQIGFDALPLLALASSAIIVGDDKQTSPENVGLDRQQIFTMMDGYLTGIPGYRTLFDPDSSLYDLARERFPTPIVLKEHFRCLPEIIAFSNRIAYDNAIIPLRDRAPRVGWPTLGLIRVLDGYRSGDLNEPEAQQVAALIHALCRDSDYTGMTFGVISLLGTAQSKRIWDLLYDRLGPEVMQERRIRCGEASNFQGDERDVMVLSTVVAVDTVNGRRIGAMTSERDLRRINVAASRARNQMWVVTSVDATDLPNNDLRAELIRHCSDPASVSELSEDLLARCESDFERRVVRMLLARGYRGVEVQHVVGRYRIDIVVNGPDGRLAVECDGDEWHGEENWHRDRARQEVLERAGWQFERIRGSAFYRDPDAAMQPVWDHIDRLDIPTGGEWLDSGRRLTVREVFGPVDPDPPQVGTDRSESRPPSAGPAVSATSAVTAAADAPMTPQAPPAAGPGDIGPHDEPPVPAAPEPAAAESAAAASVISAVHNYLRSQIDGPPGYKATLQAPVLDPPDTAPNASAATGPVSRPVTTPGIARAGGGIGSYRMWEPHPLPAITSADLPSVARGLVEIVAAEGPMYADLAYHRYVHAIGGQRVGREIQRTLDRALQRALRNGALARLVDSIPGVVHATVFAPDTPPVVIRERGPRDLYGIPRSEVNAMAEHLGLIGMPVDRIKRTLLDTYGIVRLTANASAYLDECLKYSWVS